MLFVGGYWLLSRWAEINAPETRSGEKLSFPRMRESTVYRRGTKSAINYVHLLSCWLLVVGG